MPGVEDHEQSQDQLPEQRFVSTLPHQHPARGHLRVTQAGRRDAHGDQATLGKESWGQQPMGSVGGTVQAWGWMGNELCTAGPSAAPNLLDFPEKIKPGAGRVRQPPSSARRFTQDRERKESLWPAKEPL